MPTVRELITKIAFRVEEGRLRSAGASVGRIKKQMRATARQARRLTANVNTMATGMKVAAAAFVGSRVLKVFTTGYSDGADSVAKFSKATGIGTEFLQRLTHAMELGGATAEDTQKGLKRLTKVVLDAQRGLKSAKDSFEDIGIDPKTIKADEEGVLRIADAFANMKDEGKRAAISQELFGKAGLKLVPGLRDGRKELKKYLDEASRLGIVLSKQQLKDAEDFNDELLRTKKVFQGVRNEISARLLPIITRNLVAFKDWATEGDNLSKALDRVKKAAIATAVAFIALKATKLGIAFAAALPALKTAAVLLGGVARAAAAAAAPLLVPLALITAFALAVEDLVRFARGEQSLIGRLFGDTAEGQEVKDLLLEIGKTFRGMRDEFRKVNLEFLQLFKGIVKALSKILLALAPAILRITIGLLRVVLAVSQALAWAVVKLVEGLNWVGRVLGVVTTGWGLLAQEAVKAAKAVAGAFGWAAERTQEAWSFAGENIGFIWQGMKQAASEAADAIAAPFLWAWKEIKKGWDFAVGGIIKAIDWIVDKVLTATNALAALSGSQQVGPAGASAFAAAGAKTINAQSSTSVRVGSIPITIQGTANMTPAQLEAVATKAVNSAFSGFASDLVGNRRPLVEGT